VSVRTIIGIIIVAFLGVVAVPAFAEPPASQPAGEEGTTVKKHRKHKRHARLKRAHKRHQARKAHKKHRTHHRAKAKAPKAAPTATE
jgi:hypothetical protein